MWIKSKNRGEHSGRRIDRITKGSRLVRRMRFDAGATEEDLAFASPFCPERKCQPNAIPGSARVSGGHLAGSRLRPRGRSPMPERTA